MTEYGEGSAALEKERKRPGLGTIKPVRSPESEVRSPKDNAVAQTAGCGEGPGALEQERQAGNTVLFPITLDDAVMETDQAWAASLRRTRHIGDFRAWKDHDRYQKSFERLLRDLKA
jgi:hypothetical protein